MKDNKLEAIICYKRQKLLQFKTASKDIPKMETKKPYEAKTKSIDNFKK